MCTVNIKVDENLLRDIMPELDTTAAINLWVQQLVDLRIKELIDEDDEVIDLETAREMLHETIRKEYAQL
jgi:serine protease inhibitor